MMVRPLAKKRTSDAHIPNESACFLCAPESTLVYHRDSPIFAMAGIGPVVDGFSVIAHERHVLSMADIPENETNLWLVKISYAAVTLAIQPSAG